MESRESNGNKIFIGVIILIIGGIIVWLITHFILVPKFDSESEKNENCQTTHTVTQSEFSNQPTDSGANTTSELLTETTQTIEQPPMPIALQSLTNIASGGRLPFTSNTVTDNYGNEYNGSFVGNTNLSYMVLLDYNFSRFQAVFYIREGRTTDRLATLTIFLDDNEIYRVSLDKTSRPHEIDIDISDGNIFTIRISEQGFRSHISNAVLYP